MGKTDCYCIICGAKLKSGFVCSGTCFNIYKESKNKLINGFCNLCGLPLLLEIGSKGEIWNNHIKCNLSILTRNFIEKATKIRSRDQQENLKKEFLELKNLKKKLKNNSIEKEFSKIDILESEVREKFLENQYPEQKPLERERLEEERLERERLEREFLEKERLEKKRLEEERREQERLEEERLEEERLEKERLEKEHLERERTKRDLLRKNFFERRREEKNKNRIIKSDDNKNDCLILFDEEKQTLICPHCFKYSVKFSTKLLEWYCDCCKSNVNFELAFDGDKIFCDSEKYKIYKIWGVNGLAKLTGKKIDDTQRFISSYFEDCCSSKGDRCIYFKCLEGVELRAKQVESIIGLFENEKRNYEVLFHEINQFSEFIEKNQFLLTNEEEKDTNNKFVSFKKTIEQIIEQFDDFFIVLANEDLERDQIVFIKESYGELIADSHPSTIEGFVWNKAKKGEMVGVFLVSTYFFGEINQHFIDLKLEIEYLIKLKSLSPLAIEAIRVITSEKGILQNQLWRNLNIDSRKCSRLVKSLLDKYLIRREIVTSNGARTYFLISVHDDLISETDQELQGND